MLTKLYNWIENEEALGAVLGATVLGATVLGATVLGATVLGAVNLSQLIPITPFYIFLLILSCFILMEILYNFNDKKKNPSLGWVIWLKIDGLITAFIIIMTIFHIIWLFKYYRINWDIIMRWFIYIWWGLIALTISAGILYLLYKLAILPYLEWNRRRIRR